MQKRGSVRHRVPFGQSEQESGSLHVIDTGQGGIWQGFTRFSQTFPSGQASQGSEITEVIIAITDNNVILHII